MPTTTVLNSVEDFVEDRLQYSSDFGFCLSKEDAIRAVGKCAEQIAISFVRWRSDISVVMSKRYILDLPMQQQYQIFLKENGL